MYVRIFGSGKPYACVQPNPVALSPSRCFYGENLLGAPAAHHPTSEGAQTWLCPSGLSKKERAGGWQTCVFACVCVCVFLCVYVYVFV